MRCGERDVVDLRTAVGKERFAKDRPVHPMLVVGAWLVLIALICAAGVADSEAGTRGEAHGHMLAILAWMTACVAVGRWLQARPAGLGVAVLDASTPTACIHGIARGEERLRSPLTGTPCIAYRVRGTTPMAKLDDALGQSFVVVSEEGVRTRVDIGSGGFDLETKRPTSLGPTDDIVAFLDRLGFLRHRQDPAVLRKLRLEEGVLRDGDPVAVAWTEPRGGHAGYRDADQIVREADGATVEVRAGRSVGGN